MATTNTLFILTPQGSSPTSADYATQNTVADASTPNTFIPVLLFIDGTNQHADWHVTVPSHYDGGGFTISWKGGTDSTSTGSLELEVRCINVADATIMTGDLAIDGATEATITDTPPTTPINKLNYSPTQTLSHANAGSPSVGDKLIIRATRDQVTDINTGQLQLASILILET